MKKEKIDFKVDYTKVHVLDEANTKDIKFPMVISSPHSGHYFPKEFYEHITIPDQDLHANEDWFVDELLQGAIAGGIPALLMNVSRVFIDVNRDKMEIDPTMFFNYPKEDDCLGSRRCRVGLGVIHRILENGKNIYDAPLSYNEVQERITQVYDVYHKVLSKTVDKVLKKFGFCFVLDCHSMPSKIGAMMLDDRPIDVCLGNLFEQSCPSNLSKFFMEAFSAKGYNTLYNTPYSGAYITFNYCQPRKKVYTMQLEVNRALYINEKKYIKNKKFQRLETDMSGIIMDFAKFLLDF